MWKRGRERGEESAADYARMSVGVLRALTACVSVMRMTGRRPRHVFVSLRALLRMCGGVFPAHTIHRNTVNDTVSAMNGEGMCSSSSSSITGREKGAPTQSADHTFDEAVSTLVELCAVLYRSTTLHGERTELLFLLTALQTMLLRVQNNHALHSMQPAHTHPPRTSRCVVGPRDRYPNVYHDDDDDGLLSDAEEEEENFLRLLLGEAKEEDDEGEEEDEHERDRDDAFVTSSAPNAVWPMWNNTSQQRRILLACMAAAAPYIRLIPPAQRGRFSLFRTLHSLLHHHDARAPTDEQWVDVRLAAQAIHGALAGRVEWEWRHDGAAVYSVPTQPIPHTNHACHANAHLETICTCHTNICAHTGSRHAASCSSPLGVAHKTSHAGHAWGTTHASEQHGLTDTHTSAGSDVSAALHWLHDLLTPRPPAFSGSSSMTPPARLLRG